MNILIKNDHPAMKTFGLMLPNMFNIGMDYKSNEYYIPSTKQLDGADDYGWYKHFLISIYEA